MRFKIHWLCNAPSPYNDYLFQKLAADPEIDLTVHFKDKNVSSHPWSQPMAQGFPVRYYRKTLGVDWKLIVIAIKDKSSIFVVSGWNHPALMIVLNILATRKRPFVLWTDTPNLDKPRRWLKDKLRSSWLKRLFRSASAIMGTGGPCVEVLKKMGAPCEKIINFPCWVPLPKEVNNRRPTSDNSRITFFSIGRLAHIKSYDLAIRAFEIVANTHQKQKCEFWIFGDGPERNGLELLVKKVGITDVVKFWGWQQPAFIQEKIKKADVMVHPAIWEPYGVVVLEAMALGKPVIASDKTMAAIDRITPGVNGFIHETGNIEQIAKQLAFFVENPDSIETMGSAAKRTAEEWPVERGVGIVKRIVRRKLCNEQMAHSAEERKVDVFVQ